MAAKLTRLTHKIAIQLLLVTELYHLQFSLQAVSQETFGYTVVRTYIHTYIHTYLPLAEIRSAIPLYRRPKPPQVTLRLVC
jgi:succinate dehydrogenase hydrophobic anchor subunit